MLGGACSVTGEPEGVRRDGEPDSETEGQRGGTGRGDEGDEGGSSVQKKEREKERDGKEPGQGNRNGL